MHGFFFFLFVFFVALDCFFLEVPPLPKPTVSRQQKFRRPVLPSIRRRKLFGNKSRPRQPRAEINNGP